MLQAVIQSLPEADEESIFGSSYRRRFRVDSEFTLSPSKGSNAKTLRALNDTPSPQPSPNGRGSFKQGLVQV